MKTIELNNQEATFLEEYLRYELEKEILSNFSQKIIINLIQKLTHEQK